MALTKKANNTVMFEITKGKKTENLSLYLMNCPCVYASVQAPTEKYNSPGEKEFSITVFVTEEQKDVLEDELVLNKSFFLVGKDKNKKKKIKYPLSSQLKEGQEGAPTYDDYEGLYGVKFTQTEFNRDGTKTKLDVIGTDKKPTKELVGNGSVVSLKLWGYKNEDEQFNTRLNMVKIEELVPYEGGSNMVTDDVFGVSFEREDEPDQTSKQTNDQSDDFDDVPFEVDSDDEY